MKISKKYKPLFSAVRGELKDVHTVILTGGRDSGKSFTASLALCTGVYENNHRVLYTRYTLTSASDSIIPDFNEKISLLNLDSYFHVTKDRIIANHNNGKVVFKGFKTSAGNQTANLKSLKDFSILVCEEAEEYPSYEEWDKVQLSIRATDVNALNVLILNPTTKTHWVYDEFFRKNGIPDGYNGVKNGVLYIHTTYRDLGKKFIAPKNWAKYEAARSIYERLIKLDPSERKKCDRDEIRAFKYYKYTVLGGWKEEADGLVYENWTMFDEWPEDEDVRIFGLDWGHKPDPTVLVEVRLKGKDMYVKEHIRQNEILNTDLAALIKTVIGDDEEYIVADTNPQQIAEMAALGVYMMKVNKHYGGSKPDKMRGIRKIQDKNLHIHKDSTELHRELRNYHTIVVTNSKGETKPHVVDKDDHGLDAMLYAGTRYQV